MKQFTTKSNSFIFHHHQILPLLIIFQFLIHLTLTLTQTNPQDPSSSSSTINLNQLNSKALKNLATHNKLKSYKPLNKRKEWMSLTRSERIQYTNSIICLKSKPSITPIGIAAGAKSRYDDFIVTHINQTFTIHGTANFLAWHRYFIYEFERSLRNECGYKGYQPYWNWARTSSDILNAPDFNGKEESLGSNGVYEKTPEMNFVFGTRDSINVPKGSGGGCIESGPFANMTINLGPIGPLTNVGGPRVKNPLDFNPRCITRDLSSFIAKNYQSENLILELILKSESLLDFQNDLQVNNQQDLMSLHQAGHFVFGGDPSTDIFVSPGEPMFFLHHAMVDKVWWIWQNLNPNQRTNLVAGTRTMFNNPPSPDGTLDDLVDLGFNAPPVRLRDLMSTVQGPLNYIYV